MDHVRIQHVHRRALGVQIAGLDEEVPAHVLVWQRVCQLDEW